MYGKVQACNFLCHPYAKNLLMLTVEVRCALSPDLPCGCQTPHKPARQFLRCCLCSLCGCRCIDAAGCLVRAVPRSDENVCDENATCGWELKTLINTCAQCSADVQSGCSPSSGLQANPSTGTSLPSACTWLDAARPQWGLAWGLTSESCRKPRRFGDCRLQARPLHVARRAGALPATDMRDFLRPPRCAGVHWQPGAHGPQAAAAHQRGGALARPLAPAPGQLLLQRALRSRRPQGRQAVPGYGIAQGAPPPPPHLVEVLWVPVVSLSSQAVLVNFKVCPTPCTPCEPYVFCQPHIRAVPETVGPFRTVSVI